MLFASSLIIGLFEHIHLTSEGGVIMGYLSIRQTSEKWGISVRRIETLCGEDRIPGAVRIGYAWAIPDDVEKPKDARIKNGKYIKHPLNEKDKA